MNILSFDMQIDGVIMFVGIGFEMQVQKPYFRQNTQNDENTW
jgi:hypothetical protein